MSNLKDSVAQLQQQLRHFAHERDWMRFHTPKNLATALSVEASELLEPFQWLEKGELEELDASTLQAVGYEMADVFNYLLMLADRLEVDLIEVAQQKIALNAKKYPIETSKGSAQKYKDDHA